MDFFPFNWKAQTEYFKNRIPLGGFVDTGNSIPSGYYSVDAYNGNLYIQNIPGLDTIALASSINNRGIFYPAKTFGSNASSDAYVFISNQSNVLNYKVSIPSLQTGLTSYLTIPGLFSYDEFTHKTMIIYCVLVRIQSIILSYNNQTNQFLLKLNTSKCFDPIPTVNILTVLKQTFY